MTPCLWCGKPRPADHRRRYCSLDCRRAAGHYAERAPLLRARLAELEAAAKGYGKRVPTFLVNEMDEIRRALAAGPQGVTR